MPDIPDRDDREAEIARLLSKWMRGQNRLLLQIILESKDVQEYLNKLPPEFWDEVGAEGAAMLRPFLNKEALAAAERVLDTITVGVDWGLVNEAAVDWARQYTYDLIRGINDTSRTSLQRIIPQYFEEGWNQGELRQSLSNLYSPVRAEMIARTEVTRAAVEGERLTVRELEKYGVTMIEVWQTRNDEIVCPICGPKHGKKKGDGWTENDGPPAHPRCRCWITHISSSVDEVGQVYEAFPGLGGVTNNYLPNITAFNPPGSYMINDQQLSEVQERIKSMPEGIRKIEPIDDKYRTVRKLDGSTIVIDDNLNVALIDTSKSMVNGSAWAKNDQMFLAPEFIGTPIQDHEYIHTLTFRNRILMDKLQSDYKPPYLFTHATGAGNKMGEHFTMLMTAYDDDEDKWIDNVIGIEPWKKITRNDALGQIKAVAKLLKGIGLW